jgi:hypothetical protein
VVIATGHTVTLDISNYSAYVFRSVEIQSNASLIVSGSGFLTVGAKGIGRKVTIAGQLTISGSGIVVVGGAPITVSGLLTVNASGGGLDATTSDVTIGAGGEFSFLDGEAYCSNLFINAGAKLTSAGSPSGAIDVDANATVGGEIVPTVSGTFPTTSILNIGSNFSVSGVLSVGASSISGNYAAGNGITLLAGSEVRYIAAGNQTIDPSLNYYSLLIGSSGTKSVNAVLSVQDQLIFLNSACFSNSDRNVSCGSNLINNSTATHAFGSGTYTFTGTTIGGTQATDLSGATVNFSGSTIVIGDQNLGSGAITFSGVNFTNTNSNVVIGASGYTGAVTFNGALSLSGDNATLAVQAGTVSMNALTISGTNSQLSFTGGTVGVSGNIIAGKNMTVQAPVTVGGNVDVGGNLAINNTLAVTGTVDVHGSFTISGASGQGTFTGLVTASGPIVNLSNGNNVFSGGFTHSSTAVGSSCTLGGTYSVGPAGTAPTTIHAETVLFTSTKPDFYTLVISNPSGTASSTVDVDVRRSVTLAKDLNMGSQLFTFDSDALLVATIGNGEIVGKVQRTLNDLGSYTFNGSQTTLQVPDLNEDRMYYSTLVKSAPDAQAIQRYYDIERDGGDIVPSAYTYTLGLQYRDTELNGNDESLLMLACGTLGSAGENQFQKISASSVQTSSNTVTYHFSGLLGINHRYTLADLNAPLPVELTAFTGHRKDDVVALRWTTATELNNYGFDIERAASKDGAYEVLGFVDGFGTSNTEHEYVFEDTKPAAGTSYYRLRQIDRDGSYTYSPIVEVAAASGKQMLANYPNPFNPSTTITFTAAAEGLARLQVYNALGERVADLYEAQVRQGESVAIPFDASDLPGGAYFYTLAIGANVTTGKMLLTK